MRYAILCYHDEKVTCAWSKEHDDAVMAKLGAVMQRLEQQGKLGRVARLMPTTTATTLRKDGGPGVVLDGAFAERGEVIWFHGHEHGFDGSGRPASQIVVRVERRHQRDKDAHPAAAQIVDVGLFRPLDDDRLARQAVGGIAADRADVAGDDIGF